jgi:hypothetical protein
VGRRMRKIPERHRAATIADIVMGVSLELGERTLRTAGRGW